MRWEHKVVGLHAFGTVQIARLPKFFYLLQFRFLSVKGGASYHQTNRRESLSAIQTGGVNYNFKESVAY